MWKSQCFLRNGTAVIGCHAGNSVARPGHLFNPVRRFVRKKLSDTKRRSLRPVEDVDGTPRGFRDLVKPFTFAVVVTGVSYTGAAIWQYESLRQVAKRQQHRLFNNGNYNFFGKAGGFRHQLNMWWNRLDPGEKVVCGIVGVNVAVFLAWRIPQFSAFMTTYFIASPMAKATTTWPMLLSTFSHYSFFHIFVNMYVLWSFAPVATAVFGKEQFVATYLSAGVISSFAGYMHKVARASSLPSLGASGAILALIGIVGTSYPNSQLSIAFVNKIYPHSFSADTGVKSLIVLDTLGILFGWRFLDHAAHLGGMLFGIWYAKYGHHVARRYRDGVVQYWHRLRGKS